MTANESVYGRLAERFATEDHATVNKGGGDQTYVPAEKVIGRLNLVLGVAGWSFTVVREGFTDTEAWVLGRLTAAVDGVTVMRDQYGNEPIVMGKAEKPTMDLLKKAATDSLKKTASLIGVAAYLYDADERREVQAEMREAKRPTPLRAAAHPAAASTRPASGAVPSSSSGTATPASAEPMSSPTCAECGKRIGGGTLKDGEPFTPEDAAEWGQKRFGRPLCGGHYREALTAQKRAESLVG